jgi:hypothetical protein
LVKSSMKKVEFLDKLSMKKVEFLTKSSMKKVNSFLVQYRKML